MAKYGLPTQEELNAHKQRIVDAATKGKRPPAWDKRGRAIRNNVNAMKRAAKEMQARDAKKGGSGKSMAMSNKTITIKMPKKSPAKNPTAGKANKIVGAATTQTKSKG